MSYHVTVTCPACGQPLEAEVDMIEETEGDSTIPYGTHTYLALNDYTIDWQAHHAALLTTDESDGPRANAARLSNVTCEQFVKTTYEDPILSTHRDESGRMVPYIYMKVWQPHLEKLETCLANVGGKAYEEGAAAMQSNRKGYDD